jgi:hypothetical protein
VSQLANSPLRGLCSREWHAEGHSMAAFRPTPLSTLEKSMQQKQHKEPNDRVREVLIEYQQLEFEIERRHIMIPWLMPSRR